MDPTSPSRGPELEHQCEPSAPIVRAPELVAPDFDQGLAPAAPGVAALGAVELISKDEFFNLFRATWAIPRGPIAMFGGPDLKSLDIPDSDVDGRLASDALYDIARETRALHWMLDPDAKWFPQVLALSSFATNRTLAIRAELVAWRKAKAGKRQPAQAGAPTASAMPPAERGAQDGEAL